MSTYDDQILNEQDKKKMEAAKAAYITANKAGDKNGMAAAHDYAESIRKSYGYSGGADGSGFKQIEGYEGAAALKNAGNALSEAYAGVGNNYKEQAEAQKADIDKQTDSLLKDAYVSNKLGTKNLDQSLKANGITGGLSETVRAQQQNNYENNRIGTKQAAIDAKKDIDINTNAALAENELNRANAEYNNQVTQAQFQNTAAQQQRSIQDQNISKYTSFIQNGLVDETNSKAVASALGVSEDAVRQAAAAVKNADYASVALSLLSAGVYDDSFVSMLGNRFSANTLKTYADMNKQTYDMNIASAKASLKSSGSSSDSSSGSSGAEVGDDESNYIDVSSYAANNKYGSDFTENDWSNASDELGVDIKTAKALFAQAKTENATKPKAIQNVLDKTGMSYFEFTDIAQDISFGTNPQLLHSAAKALGVSTTELNLAIQAMKEVK